MKLWVRRRESRPWRWGGGAVTCTAPWKHSSAALCDQPNSALCETRPQGCGGAACGGTFPMRCMARGKCCWASASVKPCLCVPCLSGGWSSGSGAVFAAWVVQLQPQPCQQCWEPVHPTCLHLPSPAPDPLHPLLPGVLPFSGTWNHTVPLDQVASSSLTLQFQKLPFLSSLFWGWVLFCL